MSKSLTNNISIFIDGQNLHNIEDNLFGIQINFTDTENELSNEKTIKVSNGQTRIFKENYLIMQIHFYSPGYYKLFATKELNIPQKANELYSGNALMISVEGSKKDSNILIQTTSKEQPLQADWTKYNHTGSKVEIRLENHFGPIFDPSKN